MAVHALAQLIQDVQERSDPPLSLGEIARRSGLSRSRVQQMTRNEMKAMPDPETLRALADGLRVPLRIVVDASLSSLGLPSGQPATGQGTIGELRRIVETATIMQPDERETWGALIDALEKRVTDRERRRRQRPRPAAASAEAVHAAMTKPRPVLADEDRAAGLRRLRDEFAADTRHSAEWRDAMVAELDGLIAAAEGEADAESDAL